MRLPHETLCRISGGRQPLSALTRSCSCADYERILGGTNSRRANQDLPHTIEVKADIDPLSLEEVEAVLV
jgi:hypothetical protein